jgi:septal ring factor EnvC (AmiA/AmiB activator)
MTKATEVVVYEQNESTLVEAAAKSRGLKILGVDDRKGYELVHAARMELKGYRVEIDKQRKQLTADALEWQRKVNAEAKRLTALIEPVELELHAEEKRVDDERAAIAKRLLDERMTALAAFESVLPASVVEDMGDNEFTAVLEDAAQAHESRQRAIRIAQEEKARLDAEAAAARKAEEQRQAAARAEQDRIQQAERERLAAERAELEQAQAAQRAEANRLAQERAAFEAEQARAARQRELEESRRQAAEQARKDAELMAEIAKQEAEERAARQAEEAARIEKLKPEIERVRAFANSLEQLDVPEVWCADAIRDLIGNARDSILTLAEIES